MSGKAAGRYMDEVLATAQTFSAALSWAKLGKRITRTGWNGKGMWVQLQKPDSHSKMTLPYLYLSYPSEGPFRPGAKVPWLASQTDLLAEDWTIAEMVWSPGEKGEVVP